MTNGDLISREALKKALDEYKYCGFYDKLIEIIDNAPTVNLDKTSFIEGFKAGCEHGKKCYERPQDYCDKCDYYSFSQAFINGIVELISKNGLTSIDELLETLKKGANNNE